MQEMSINRALKKKQILLQELDEFIFNDKKSSVLFCCKEVDENSDLSIEKLKEKQGNLDRLISVVEQLTNIQKAITESNSKTIINFCGEECTVAQVLSLINIYKKQKNILCNIRDQLNAAEKNVEAAKGRAESGLNQYLATVLGSDKKSRNAEEVERYTNDYYKRNKVTIVKPSNLDKVIKDLEKKIEYLETELDSDLTDSNAKTIIQF